MLNGRVPPSVSRSTSLDRLVDGDLRRLIGSHSAAPLRARQEWRALGDRVSSHGHQAVRTAVRLTAKAAGQRPEGQRVIAQEAALS
jgi:hypothetical protein